MPSKRPSPLEEPPSASSSSEEESEEAMAERDEDESEEESEEEDEEEEEEQQAQTPIAKPSPKKSIANSRPNPASTLSSAQPRSNSDSDEESDTESGSDSEPSPEKPKLSRGADPSVKPITSKPMSSNAKPKKSSSSGTAVAATALPSTPGKPASSAPKRSLEVDKSEKETTQKKKKKKSGDAQEEDGHAEESEKKQGEDPKKLFQRVWSEEDEIVILKGMLSFMKKELNPTTNLDAFLDSIKGSLSADVNKAQLHSKLQRLKQKYMNQANRAKNGKDPNFSKPHDLKSYQLSKKIWGRKGGDEDGAEVNNGGRDSVSTDGKKSKSGKTGNGVASSQPKVVAMPDSHLENVDEDEERSISMIQFGKGLTAPPPFFGDFVAKQGLGLLGSSKSKEFEQKWKQLVVDETKMYLRRLDLLREHAKSMLDALEPPSDS